MGGAAPLKIQTKESASFEQLCENVKENLKMIDRWVPTKHRINDKTALLISAGKSFTDDPKKALDDGILKHPSTKDTHTLFCVKHCLPYFRELRRKPDFCVALDPRPLEGVSTLGHVRKDLFIVYPETTYLIASMTHHSVTRYLLEQGANVVGWHSACQAMQHPELKEDIKSWIGGGSCSAMRSFNLAQLFGFKKMALLGFDSVIDRPEGFGELDEKGRPKYLKIKIGGKHFYTTPELAAQIQDIENSFKMNQYVVYENFSGGAAQAIFETYGLDKINPPNFQQTWDSWKK
jgi:hypothetical protein